MDFSKRNLNILLGAVILLILLLGILFATGVLDLSKFGVSLEGGKVIIGPEASKLMSVTSAYDTALTRAREWQADATLARTQSVKEKTDKFGHSDDWEFLFVSKSAPKKGYIVVVAQRTIVKAEEVPYVGTGEALPQNIISSEEAITYVRTLKGYENQPILSIEMYYNQDAKEWRWGVKTAKGTVSVKASR